MDLYEELAARLTASQSKDSEPRFLNEPHGIIIEPINPPVFHPAGFDMPEEMLRQWFDGDKPMGDLLAEAVRRIKEKGQL